MKLVKLNIYDINNNQIKFVKSAFPKRYERALKYKYQEDYLRCVGAYILLYKELGSFTESDLYFNEHGKPYIKNKPFFSYSHSGDYICLVIDNYEVGVDIEKVKDFKISNLCRVFNEKELVFGDKSNKNFYEIWTKKESYLKLTGQGITANLNLIDTTTFNSDNVERKVFNRVVFFDDYVISICSFNEFCID